MPYLLQAPPTLSRKDFAIKFPPTKLTIKFENNRLGYLLSLHFLLHNAVFKRIHCHMVPIGNTYQFRHKHLLHKHLKFVPCPGFHRPVVCHLCEYTVFEMTAIRLFLI